MAMLVSFDAQDDFVGAEVLGKRIFPRGYVSVVLGNGTEPGQGTRGKKHGGDKTDYNSNQHVKNRAALAGLPPAWLDVSVSSKCLPLPYKQFQSCFYKTAFFSKRLAKNLKEL